MSASFISRLRHNHKITTAFHTIIRIIQNKYTRRFILEGQIIEIIRTIAPAIILVFIAIPSLRLSYLTDEIHNPVITLKAAEHQRYWSYEYSDFTKLKFDSHIVQQERYGKGRLWVLQYCCLEEYCILTRRSSFIHLQGR